MRNFRAYCAANSIEIGANYQLANQTSHHLQKVLRVSLGDPLEIFDGCGHRYEAVVENFKPQFTIKVLKEKPSNTVSPLKICLMIAVGKGDKMDWLIQKATELGVSEIIPLTSSRVEVRLNKERWQKKIAHWKEISINACEQCSLDQLPKIHDVLAFSLACQMPLIGLKLLLHPGEGARTMKAVLSKVAEKAIHLLIGPEGGFEDKEVDIATQAGFQRVSLGPRILRMETAALASITLAQGLLGDL